MRNHVASEARGLAHNAVVTCPDIRQSAHIYMDDGMSHY